MNDKPALQRVIVRVLPSILGIYLGAKIALLFQDLTGIHGGMDSQFAPIAILAFVLGMCIVVWSLYKELKIPMALSFVLLCCGALMTTFGMYYFLLAR